MIKATKIYDNLQNVLEPTVLQGACDHQFKGTQLENLVEYAGRICYDSLGSEKTRGSLEYHQHIIEVNHGSVQEHGTIVLNLYELNSFELHDAICQCVNRPGVSIYYRDIDNSDGKARFKATVVANLRAIREWDSFGGITATGLSTSTLDVGILLKQKVNRSAPRTYSLEGYDKDNKVSRFKKNYDYDANASVAPDETTFVSFLIQEVSRNLSHELVRHKFQTAISQRSTRYVDESLSNIAWHPLLEGRFRFAKWFCKKAGQIAYRLAVQRIKSDLIAEGATALQAKKQARGAARGFLPSALETELVFTASVSQWKRIIAMRNSSASDLEIQQLAAQIENQLRESRFIV